MKKQNQSLLVIISTLALHLCPGIKLHAQSGPLRFPSPFLSGQTDTLTLTIGNQIPDSSKLSFSAIRFNLNRCEKKQAIYLAAGNSGGLLAFEDSLMKKPLILEKRSGFQFQVLKAGLKLNLLYTCRPGPGAYLGFRLLEAGEKGKILDEVVWCCPDYAADCFYSAFYGWLEVK